MLAFHPTDCQPELPSGCPRCGENTSLICCDIEHPISFHSLQTPPVKVDRAMRRSRVEPIKLSDRSTADMKLVDALENWHEETTKARYGDATLLDFGPSLIMSTKVLDRIINCVHHQKISSLQDLARETRWDKVSRYGAEILALILAIHPVRTSASEPKSTSAPTARKVKCGSCGQLGHNGM